MKIKNIKLNKVYDSRGEETLEVILIDENGNYASSQIPQGKSKGSNEVVCLDFQKAKNALENLILPEILNKEFLDIKDLDQTLIKIDGTKDKSNLGGNLTLGLSLSFTKILAIQKKEQLWQVLQESFFNHAPEKIVSPKIFVNLINGGTHADNNLSFQEYMIVANHNGDDTQSKIEKIIKFYNLLQDRLKNDFKMKQLPIGDEAGFSLDFKSNDEPIAILEELIKTNDFKNDFRIALDAAASSFYRDENYAIDGKNFDKNEISTYYTSLFSKYEFLQSVEDPFYESDFESHSKLKSLLTEDKLIVGDDLTTTNKPLIERAGDEAAINAVIIKPNQIGTVTETANAINAARDFNLKTIISHRSGETEDNFLIHFAKASNAYGVKIGSPRRERIFKYNELLRLY